MTSRQPLVVAVDLGGTKIEAALVTEDGEIQDAYRCPTEAQEGPDAVVDRMVAAIRDRLLPRSNRTVAGVGIGVAGQVEPGTGEVFHAPNLAWDRYPLRERLEAALDMPVAVINDVQAATYGEWLHGAGTGTRDLVCMFVGTGVGGGVISNAQLVQGCSGSAGELGHLTIDLNGPLCHCGNRGCLEAFAGGWAIARRATEAVHAGPEAGQALLRDAGEDAEAITAEIVAQTARSGDPLANRLLREAGEALGAGAASVVNAFNPCLLILGGGIAEGIPALIDRVREGVQQRSLAAARRQLRIATAQLGEHAGTIGAAAWARTHIAAKG